MDLPWLSNDETVTAWSRMSEERVEGVALCIQAARLESREKGNASMANSVQQSGDGAKKGKLAVLFEDLSIAQVIAGALAAATVFLLSSVIGVAGSLIGAAVGSIVSAVSSQVYKKMLSASADKIRDVAPDGTSANQADPNETRLMEPVSSSETRVIDSDKIAASATKVMGADDIRYQAHASSDKTVDPALQRAHVRRRRKARVQRSVIIVSIVSALIAIVVSAGLIHVFTDGQGIGEKTEPIFTASEASQAKQGSSASNGATKETAANKSTSSKSNEGSSQSGKSSSADSSTSSTSASGSGSGSGSSDSSASSNGGSSSSDNSSECRIFIEARFWFVGQWQFGVFFWKRLFWFGFVFWLFWQRFPLCWFWQLMDTRHHRRNCCSGSPILSDWAFAAFISLTSALATCGKGYDGSSKERNAPWLLLPDFFSRYRLS